MTKPLGGYDYYLCNRPPGRREGVGRRGSEGEGRGGEEGGTGWEVVCMSREL